MLAQCLHLLRGLPEHTAGHATVADVLRLLSGSEVPTMTPAEPAGSRLAQTVLRAGEPEADVVPGHRPRGHTGAYDTLLRDHEGPERIVELGVPGRQVPPPSIPRGTGARRTAVDAVRGWGRPAGPPMTSPAAWRSGRVRLRPWS